LVQMADTLYLSLWYPNLRLEALPGKLAAVLGAFAAHGGESTVYAATVWPVSWNEAPVFQRLWGRCAGGHQQGAEPRQAVDEATELLHDDYAYEFQIGWSLWELEAGSAGALPAARPAPGPSTRPLGEIAREKSSNSGAHENTDFVGLDRRWVRESRLARVTGLGPLFDEAAYEQEGHIKVDLGSDAPFLEEDAGLGQVGAKHVEENVRQLVDLAAAIEKGSGATARLLWSELGESLAQRLAGRLGAGN